MRVLPPTLLLEDAPMRVDPKADELADPKRALLGPAHEDTCVMHVCRQQVKKFTADLMQNMKRNQRRQCF